MNACFPRCVWIHFGLACWLCLGSVTAAFAQLDFERPPIDYHNRPASDPVARLQQRLDSGETQLTWRDGQGYLASVLELLEISESSQTLVFSKTSFQLRRITPERPRAIYFNDDTFVGWVQNGDVMEFSAVDPDLGAVFYTLSLDPTEKPQFVRDRGQCLTCHASSRTQGVPGHLVRSVFSDRIGQPLLGSGTFTTNHSSPFNERWGGWYVSGTHGAMRHMGNAVADRNAPEQLDVEAGANITDLSSLVDTSPYLSPHSDLVALMVLEHQTQMHNFLTLANYETRSALHYDTIMNSALGRPADFQSESTERRIAAVAERVVRCLLFVDEFQLQSPVAGVSSFAADFAAQGPSDTHGRSLRQFDLERRLFKYPCSFLIYSASFDAMPEPVKTQISERLLEVLSGQDTSPEFAHLSLEDRTAIREILEATKPELWSHSATRSE